MNKVAPCVLALALSCVASTAHAQVSPQLSSSPEMIARLEAPVLVKPVDFPTYSISPSIQDKVRVWTVGQKETPKEFQSLNQAKLEQWLRTLKPGAQLDLYGSCIGGDTNNATPEEIKNLRTLTQALGLKFNIIPAG